MTGFALSARQVMTGVAWPVEVFYTGRTNDQKNSSSWVSVHACEAFRMSRELAERRAAQFNTMTSIHGLTFAVVPA